MSDIWIGLLIGTVGGFFLGWAIWGYVPYEEEV